MSSFTIFVSGQHATAPIELNALALQLLPRLEGRKRWVQGGLKFESTQHNLRLFKDVFQAEIVDDRDKIAEASNVPIYDDPYNPPFPRLVHQEKAFEQGMKLPVFANYSDPGTGKSKLFIDMFGTRYMQGLISGVLLYAPKGVHRQWIEQQIPLHIDPAVRWKGLWWRKNKRTVEMAGENNGFKGALDIFALNIDSVNTTLGIEVALSFAAKHQGKLYIGVDESDSIANYKSQRSKNLRKHLRDLARFRHIMTGTPGMGGLEDIWGQFFFLDEEIIGIKYQSAFRREYCIMGGFQNREVTGYRDIEKFNKIVGPYIFRATQKDIGRLPPTVTPWRFNMEEEQREAFDQLKAKLFLDLDNGLTIKTPSVGTKLLRLAQIASGFISYEEDDRPPGSKRVVKIKEFANPRLEALLECKSTKRGKAAIWCRFQYDVEAVLEALGKRALPYYGPIGDEEREHNKNVWLDEKSSVDDLVLTAGAGGVGLNLQGACRMNIFYSHENSSRKRRQSELRIDRIGAAGMIENINLICRGSTDAGQLRNYKRSAEIQDLSVRGVKELFEDWENYVQ